MFEQRFWPNPIKWVMIIDREKLFFTKSGTYRLWLTSDYDWFRQMLAQKQESNNELVLVENT